MKGWRARLAPVVTALQPIARVAERTAAIAVHIQKPTITGVAGVAGTALSALSDVIGNSRSSMWMIDVYVSRGQLIRAVRDAGARVTITRRSDGSEFVECQANGITFWVNRSSVSTCVEAIGQFVEWLRKAIDRVLPDAVEIRRQIDMQGEIFESRHAALSQHDNAQSDSILGSTLPLIDGGRCILLDGRPGVGKTTLAQIVARRAGLGRVVLLENTLVGSARDGASAAVPESSSSTFRDALGVLSPGVVVVDDIDKINLSLPKLEALRAASRLVILTANNGQYDDVLDAALMRAGRVDEVFSVEAVSPAREHPFDRLADAEWDEIREWPIAYLNEVRKRLMHRPNDARLDDLRQRLTRKTRSGEVLR